MSERNELTGTFVSFFYTTGDPPSLEAYDVPGWAVIAGPTSDEEVTRLYCAIQKRADENSAWVVVAEGTTLEPLDGSPLFDDSAASGNQYRAVANYSTGPKESVAITIP